MFNTKKAFFSAMLQIQNIYTVVFSRPKVKINLRLISLGINLDGTYWYCFMWVFSPILKFFSLDEFQY